MKKYDGKTMASHSRFIEYLKTMELSQLKEVENKIDIFINENKEYCDSGNYQHLCNIFTCMATINGHIYSILFYLLVYLSF